MKTGQIEANLYKGQDKPVPAILMDQSFTVRKELPDSLVYELMKVAFDHNDEFRGGHPLMAGITPAFALGTTLPVVWHAGGVTYWKEKGLWTKEHESKQKSLLAELGQDK